MKEHEQRRKEEGRGQEIPSQWVNRRHACMSIALSTHTDETTGEKCDEVVRRASGPSSKSGPFRVLAFEVDSQRRVNDGGRESER